MGVVFYNLVLILSLPLILPFFVYLMITRSEYRTGLAERLGSWPGSWDRPEKARSRIWVHAASVGECLAVLPMIERFLADRPEWDLVFSVMTPAGRRLIEQRLGDRVRARFFPMDFPGLAGRLLRRVAPDLILLAETELWPNFLRSATQCDIPVLLVNGRISPRSYRRYRSIRWLFRETLRKIRIFGMQSAQDAQRIIDLGAPPERVRVLGNLKFDQAAVPLSETERQRLLGRLGWHADDKILVAGSTHEKEEEYVLNAFLRIREGVPNLRLILAPRHLNRLPGLAGLLARCEKEGVRHSRYSDLDRGSSEAKADILLVDTMGQLGRLYGLGTVVFVGGSLVPVGGHNLMEPAALGRPVLFGPFFQHVQETADLLLASGGGRMVHDVGELVREVRVLLTETAQRRTMERLARDTVRGHQGASARAFVMVEEELKKRLGGPISRRDFRSALERWFKERMLASKGGALTSLAAAGLRGASILYQAWQEIRTAAYSLGLLRSVRVAGPVISVGNLTLGGTGKTPTVMAVSRLLAAQGHRPAVLSRGYGGRIGRAIRVASASSGIAPGPEDVGDEPSLMADRLRGVPVVVSSDRVAAARYALETLQTDVLVLDDGYQHLRLKRDLNLLVVDAVEPFGNGHVFPRGTLRESVGHLGRADAVLLTHVDHPDETAELQKFIRRYRSDLPIFTSRHRIVELVPLGGGSSWPFEKIKGLRLVAVAGIGQPDRFVRMLQAAGADVAAVFLYPDHYRYRREDVEAIETEAGRREAPAIVTTEKDAVRIRKIGRPMKAWRAGRLELVIDQSEAFQSMLRRVFR
ncbi:MAG TPA: tetraacyldisaccharide 4'-kinase [Nitrospiria bacterium]|nr:tetraacyldisaccharide 4'-kinase [Nitrospiria bacterium]